jgi:hypothetical protein
VVVLLPVLWDRSVVRLPDRYVECKSIRRCTHSLHVRDREGDPTGWSMVLVTALGSWGKHRGGDPKGWSTVLVTALGSWRKHIGEDP